MISAAANLAGAFAPLIETIGRGKRQVTVAGLTGSAKALALAHLASAVARPVLVVAPNQVEAEGLTRDLACFVDLLALDRAIAPLLFPDTELLPYQWTAPAPDIVMERAATLTELAFREWRAKPPQRHLLPLGVCPPKGGMRGPVVVAPLQAASLRLVPRRLIREATVVLTKGQPLDRDDLVGRLGRLGYRQVPLVDRPGQMSVRGGIVDVFSPARTLQARPVRIEMAGDTVESLRLFDTASQRSLETVESAPLIPTRDLIADGSDLDRACRTMRQRLADSDLPPAALERQLAGLTTLPPGTEWLTPFFYDRLETLVDYMAGALLVLDEPDVVERERQALLGQAEQGFAEATRGGFLVPRPAELYSTVSPAGHQALHLSALSLMGPTPPDHAYATRTPATLGIGQVGTTLSSTFSTLRTLQPDHRIAVICRTSEQQHRLRDLCAEYGLPATSASVIPAAPATGGPLALLMGPLTAGFLLPDLKVLCLTEEELLGKRGRTRPAKGGGVEAFLPDIAALKVGDPVVHLHHGIGRYRGLERLTIQGVGSEFLVIEYLGGDRLLVPIDRLDLVQTYVGVEGRIPRLHRLGGIRWTATLRRTKQAVEAVAKELVDLYAARQVLRGHAFSQDDMLAHEFAAAFEYEETPDQLTAIEEVGRNMESDRSMDRLICGDVGYGKTEVAMRAAFKAVADSRQVAVLVPTTLLAQQHAETFRRRFARQPVRVETLSRFLGPREQHQILQALQHGTIDIIIGTHRLLQKDVVIPHLGLLIVDEEQRFGVSHKERLKQWRKTVDVLTLTATPIPRTLQLSLAGVRDLSVITTPPGGRLSIRTTLIGFDPRVIREAILRELGRGGQVFFVHNRIQTIHRVADLLRRLMPEARLEVAHGRMPERRLEAVMRRFLSREADLLIATTIIASGLDIPTANTIFIDRADLLGLADLYQLRGRVGRSGEQAYAYLLVPESSGQITDQAHARLQAIQEFVELGSGFRLAARDLEIRGAGTLLGTRQSGHIAAVGLEFYLNVLEQAVRAARGEVLTEEPIEPTLNLRVSAYLPDDYIPDAEQRLTFYKRLASVRTEPDLTGIEAELSDRYGRLPEPARHLLEVVSLKRLCRQAGVSRLDGRAYPWGQEVVLTFDENRRPPDARVRALLDREDERLQVVSPGALSLRVNGEWKSVEHALRGMLRFLGGEG